MTQVRIYEPEKISNRRKNTKQGILLINTLLSLKSFKEHYTWRKPVKCRMVKGDLQFYTSRSPLKVGSIRCMLSADDPLGYFNFRVLNYDWPNEYNKNENEIIFSTLEVQAKNPMNHKGYLIIKIKDYNYLIFEDLMSGLVFQGTPEEIQKYNQKLCKLWT